MLRWDSTCSYLYDALDSCGVHGNLALLQNFCASFGANLASVHSIWEYGFLQNLMKTTGHSFAWIGGYYFEVCRRKTEGRCNRVWTKSH